MAVPLLAAIPVIGDLLGKVIGLIPDSNAKAKAEAEQQLELLKGMLTESADQREINKVEAAHVNIFVAGWRPAIGWVCAAALAFAYLIRPFWVWGAAIWWPDAPAPPELGDMLWELMFGMLGLGGLRTVEKLKGKGKTP